MNLLNIILISALALTFLSILLLIVIIGLRIFTDRSIDHESSFRKRALPVIKGYLSGDASVDVTAAILRKDPDLALQLLMQEYDALGEAEKGKLHPLFSAFPTVKKEIDSLKSLLWQTRLHAAERLGYLGDDSALPALMTALRDDVVVVRFAAARSLCQLDCQEAVEPIIHSLDVPGEVSQRRVAEILVILGARAIEPILDILKTPSYNEASHSIAARVAGLLRAERAVSALQNLLTHQAPNVRLNAVRSLALIEDHSTTPSIASLSEDSSWEVRSSVMTALGRLHASDRIPLLLQGLSDPEWWVRHNAATSLIQLGDPGIKELRNAVDHHVDAYGRDVSRQILQQQGLLPVTSESHS
ncbi:MAG: HEAT repeat domain-containing protein [bacterium]